MLLYTARLIKEAYPFFFGTASNERPHLSNAIIAVSEFSTTVVDFYQFHLLIDDSRPYVIETGPLLSPYYEINEAARIAL